MGRPRVLLAEDNSVMAAELRKLLEPELEVVATVADGQALVAAAPTVRPDVIVSDITMPGLDGIRATAALRARNPDTRVVLVTVHDDATLAERAYLAGALACVVKLTAADHLVPAVRAALRGERYVTPRLRDPPI